MKRMAGWLALLIALCAVSVALGAELTWNQICTKKTNRATTIYKKLNENSDELTPTSSLPAGSYIRTTGQEIGGKAYVAYSMNNSDPLYGYIDKSVIVSAVGTYTLSTGQVVKVPEALLRSKAALDIYLKMEYGETSGDKKTYIDVNGNENAIGNEKAANGEDGSDDAAWQVGMAKAAVKNGTYTPTFYHDAEGKETEVTVVSVGLARSTIVLNGEQAFVDTDTLTWETKAPENKVLAVVKAKRYARMRVQPTGKALIMDKCENGMILRVLDTDKNWTFVDYNGLRGYVMTSMLTFYPNEHREYRTGRITTKSGHVKGSVTVHVRNLAKNKQMEEYPVGTPLTVFEEDEKWCQVELNGHLCYIKREFMRFDEELQTANADNGT